MKVLMPPELLQDDKYKRRVFLAGSIEMGKAELWQDQIIKFAETPEARNYYHSNNTLFYNPRRADWDSTWKQDITDGNFYRQVSWELTALERSTHILYYFAPNTMSPISLLELGKFSSYPDKKIVVVASPEYARKGNVDVFCERYRIGQAGDLIQGFKYLMVM